MVKNGKLYPKVRKSREKLNPQQERKISWFMVSLSQFSFFSKEAMKYSSPWENCFFFFLAAPQHMEFLGQGSDPATVVTYATDEAMQTLLNPLCQARDRTCILAWQRYCWSHCTTRGISRIAYFLPPSCGLPVHKTRWRLVCVFSWWFSFLKLVTPNPLWLHVKG